MRHFPNVEAPDAFNRIMLGWLDAQRRGQISSWPVSHLRRRVDSATFVLR